VLRAAAQRGLDHPAQGGLDGAWRARVRREHRGAAARGRVRRLAARGGMKAESWSAALAAPIFATLRPSLSRLAAGGFPGLDDLNALAGPALASGGGAPIRFVPPAPLEEAYEIRVFETGEVQTRPDNWHDLFNALVWIAFPRTKAALNRHH